MTGPMIHLPNDSVDTDHPLEASGGLKAANFRKISENGFGDPLNAYPHSMRWFKNHLYVGTTRANLQLLWFGIGERSKNFEIWPVETPEGPYDQDIRAHVWRYDPVSEHWENVFVSPMIMGSEGFEVPLALGFRGTTAYQGPNDPSPALYFPTWASRLGPGPVLIRSYDGREFETVSEPGLGDPTVTTIRSIVSFKDRLFLSPTGTTKDRFSGNIPDRLVIFVGRDPTQSDWEMACEPSFGDSTNLGVFCMAVFRNHLYAGTANSEKGFELWKTDAEGKPPYQWKRVLHHGGYRGKENQGAVSMAEFKGKLYVGTGIIGGVDRERNVGPASPELFRVGPDDSWELIVGEPRITPEGLKVPLSGLGAGFNSPMIGYFWSMCSHEGWLYLGTYDVTTWLPFVRSGDWPRSIRRYVETNGVDNIIRNWAGFDFWRSRDGVKWFPVSRNGFGNPFNYGIRTMASTPHGLFVGAANPFGPKTAVKGLAGWRYLPNARGGLEIWQGFRSVEQKKDASHELPEKARRTVQKAPPGIERERDRLLDEYYEKSGFRICGLWRHQTTSTARACEDLVEELVALLPAGARKILEIGCDRGVTSREITKRIPQANFHGITQSQEKLRHCRWVLPEGSFRKSKGHGLKYMRSVFDAVLSLEGLKNFGNPGKLFKEIHRVLVPGGRLAFCDILVDTKAPGGNKRQRNIADSLPELDKLLTESGFSDTALYDLTSLCWEGLQNHFYRKFSPSVTTNEISRELFNRLLEGLPNRNLPVEAYFICTAVKKQP